VSRPIARNVRGFRDLFASDLLLKQGMIDRIRRVYESHGFIPLETPAVEFVDVLGKFLPEAHTPEGGIFSFANRDLGPRADPQNPDYWTSLRYDLTAPLARVVAQYPELPRPFRRYQIGPVWRYEKPGPGRFREFFQFDFDSVGVPSVAADAEVCAIMCDVFEALGFAAGDYIVKVNDRKIMQGVLEACELPSTDVTDESSSAAAILRSIDKLDRLGIGGVRQLLGSGRKDETGDFTKGAGLSDKQIALVDRYLAAQVPDRREACDVLEGLVGQTPSGAQGIKELRTIDAILRSQGIGDDRVVFDPTIIRGLSYYTGPVFEGQLKVKIKDEEGVERQFGTVFGGGRYDDLVERFTGKKVPATGASVGVDRLLEAMKLLASADRPRCTSQVLVTVMDQARLPDYFEMARAVRRRGYGVEVYLGAGRLGQQLKYADNLGIALAVIAGEDEFARGEVQIKDLRAGALLAEKIEDRQQWKEHAAQQSVKIAGLPDAVERLMKAQHGK
jgi:histidyl-tRNA synthetase